MKNIVVATEDFRLYHDVVLALKEAGLSFITLHPSDTLPSETQVVLTSYAESHLISHENVVAVEGGTRLAVYRVLHVLSGRQSYENLVVGVDPGPRPGVAIVGDGDVLRTEQLENVEELDGLLEDSATAFPSRVSMSRVGHGDRIMRNRIINILMCHGLGVEIVDEASTSTIHRRDTAHVDAAVTISFSRGRKVSPDKELSIEPKDGEVREIQRRSRNASGGRRTLNREAARLVAMGVKTMDEALEDSSEKEGQ